MVQLGGHVTNTENPNTVVRDRDRGGKAGHVRQDRLAAVSDRTRWRAKLEESWRPTTLALVMRNEKSRSLLAYVADLARDQHRRVCRVVLFRGPEKNVETCSIESVLTESPLVCS